MLNHITKLKNSSSFRDGKFLFVFFTILFMSSCEDKIIQPDNSTYPKFYSSTVSLEEGWSIFSSPLILNNNVDSLLSSSLGNQGLDYVYFTQSGEFSNMLEFQLGVPFYLGINSSNQLTIEGYEVAPNDSLNYLNLKEGWNFIASTRNKIIDLYSSVIHYNSTQYSFLDAVNCRLISPELIGLNGNSIRISDRLHPFKGYWIYSNQSQLIKLNEHTTNEKYNYDWSLELKVSEVENNFFKDIIIIGLDHNASNGIFIGEDIPDIPEMPTANSGINIYMNGMVDNENEKFWKNIKPMISQEEYQTWTIYSNSINTNMETIQLSWTMEELDEIHEILMLLNGETINMREVNNVIIHTDYFNSTTIIVGNNPF